ncbi:MAG: lipid-binding SYLF domain-containing protein [Pseudomonadota bacterium]
MSQIYWRHFSWLVLAIFLVMSTKPVSAKDIAALQELVNQGHTSLQNFVADPNMGWFRKHVKDAKAVFIVPQLLRAGFIFGGSGGNGILLARDENTRSWSDPAFYTMGSVSWGLQLGVQAAEVILMIMTVNGLDSMLSTKFQLGADASVAAGPVGVGAQAATTDILAFSRTKGLFGGLTIEGAVITSRDKWSSTYYDQTVRPVDILIRREVSNVNAMVLRRTLTQSTDGG